MTFSVEKLKTAFILFNKYGKSAEQQLIDFLHSNQKPSMEEIRAENFELKEIHKDSPLLINTLLDVYANEITEKEIEALFLYSVFFDCIENLKILCARRTFRSFIYGCALNSAVETSFACLKYLLDNYSEKIDPDEHLKDLVVDPFSKPGFLDFPSKYFALSNAVQKSNLSALEYLLNDPSVSFFADFNDNTLLKKNVTGKCLNRLLQIPSVALLHYAKNGKINSEYSGSELKDIFCNIISLAEALNKIGPTLSSESSFRAERYITEGEFQARIAEIKAKGSSFTKMIAYTSTSSKEESIEGFKKEAKSMIVYDSLSGINVETFSLNPKEKEHILFPHVVMLEDCDQSVSPPRFKATVLKPLLEQQEIISHTEIEVFLFLKNLTEKLSINVDNLTLWAYHFLQKLDYDLLLAAKEVTHRYLNQPYPRTDYAGSFVLKTAAGEVYRPNHGLAHALRCMMLVPIVAQSLNLKLPQEEIKKLQLASLFFIAGRENECSFSENPDLYLSFRKKSAEAFKEYAQKIGMESSEIDKFYRLVLNDQFYSNPNFENNPDYHYAFILNIAHNLDLVRCNNQTKLHEEVIDDPQLNKKVSKENIQILLNYARELIIATGDCVAFYGGSIKHNEILFHGCSTNVAICLEKILSVNPPVFLQKKSLQQKRKREFLPLWNDRDFSELGSYKEADKRKSYRLKKRKLFG